MSDTTTQTADTTDAADQQTQGDPAADDKPLGENGEKALKAEREARAKAERAAAGLQQQLDAINRANETAVETAQRELKEAKDAAAQATTEALRLRVAAKHGISDEDADLFLTGSDIETVERQASALVARTSTTAGPRPDLSQGSKGGDASDPKAAFAALLSEMPG